MFKHYFEQIEGIEIYPLVSLLIFFVFFLLLIWWVIKVDSKYIAKMKGLPFEAGDLQSKEQNNNG